MFHVPSSEVILVFITKTHVKLLTSFPEQIVLLPFQCFDTALFESVIVDGLVNTISTPKNSYMALSSIFRKSFCSFIFCDHQELIAVH